MPLLMPLFESLSVPAIYCQLILLDVGANGRLADYLWNRYPPDLFKRDSHQTEVAAIDFRVKS